MGTVDRHYGYVYVHGVRRQRAAITERETYTVANELDLIAMQLVAYSRGASLSTRRAEVMAEKLQSISTALKAISAAVPMAK